MQDEPEQIAKEGVKKDLKKLLKEIDGMTTYEIHERLSEIIWGIGYNEGYFVGHYEGETGHSYACKEEGT